MKERTKLRQFLDGFYGCEISNAEFEEYKGRLAKFLELLIEINKREKVLGKIGSGGVLNRQGKAPYGQNTKGDKMTNETIKIEVDSAELLNKTHQVNVLFKTIYQWSQELYCSDPGFEEGGAELYEFADMTLIFIPFINKRLSDCEDCLPKENLSQGDADAIRELSGIECQYQGNLEIILPLILKIISVVDDKKSLLSISEMLCHLYYIGSFLLQIPDQNSKLVYLIEKVGQINNYINEKMNCCCDQEFEG